MVPSTTEKAADGITENLIKIHFHWRQNILILAESRMLSPVVSEEWCLPVGEFWRSKQDPFFFFSWSSKSTDGDKEHRSSLLLCDCFLREFFSSRVITCQQPWHYFRVHMKEKYLNFSKEKYLISVCVRMIWYRQKI